MTEQAPELPPPTAPYDVAERFLADTCTHPDALTLRYWRGTFWCWAGSHWAEQSRDHIRALLYDFTKCAIYVRKTKEGPQLMPWCPNDRRVSALVDALKAASALPDDIEPGSWLVERQSGKTIALQNGLLEVNGRKLVPHTPLFFNTLALSFAYDAAAECPNWDGFMADLWGNGEEPLALEEALGAAIAGKLDLHRILVLVGAPRSGKSTISAIFEALAGRPNVASPNLIGLTDDKTLASVIGKSLVVIGDVRAMGGKEPHIAEVLLKISGGDSFTIDRKYKDPWTGRLLALIVMVSNELPTIRDASGALPARYLTLILQKSWKGREDLGLRERLLGELPGILNHALDGLDELEKNGRFTEPAASREIAEELSDMASPMARFLEERCIVDADHSAPVDELWREYNSWAQQYHEATVGKDLFGKRLHAAIPEVTRTQQRVSDGRRIWKYSGVRLARDADGLARVAAAAKRQWGVTPRVVEGDER